MGRKPLSPEQKLERLRKTQEKIVASPAQKFLESCMDGGVYIESPDAAEHNHGHYVGVQRLKTEKAEGGYDCAVVIFEVMKSVIDGRLLRKPRYTSSSTGGRQVVYPQMVLEWAQVEGVARAMLNILGGKAGAIKEEVLSSDKVVKEERVEAVRNATLDQLRGLDV
jgi:hypothetical protein